MYVFYWAGDLYQRQPLLPNPAKGDKWGHSSQPTDGYIDEDEEGLDKSGKANGVIKISMPPPIREEPRFPQERWKTLTGMNITNINYHRFYKL